MKYFLRFVVLSLFLATASLSAQEANSDKKTEAVQAVPKQADLETPAVTPAEPTETEPVAEERPATPTYEGAFLKMILVLLLLLFIIFFGVWAIRRLSRSRLRMFKEPKHIRIIDRRSLSAKTALYLVEVGEKRVLVAESQLEVKGLATIDLEEKLNNS